MAYNINSTDKLTANKPDNNTTSHTTNDATNIAIHDIHYNSTNYSNI